MIRPEHPIFGRAAESDEDDDRAFMLEGQLQRFYDQVQTEMDRLDDFLPHPKFVGKQEADDWAADLHSVLEPTRLALRAIDRLVNLARANRAKVAA
jgi:hypothetical protein